MTEAMRLAAKAASILVIAILFAIIWFLISVEFTSSENIVIDRYDKYVSFYSTSDDIGSHGQSMDVEVNEKKYQGIGITEVIPTDTFVGTNRVYIYIVRICLISRKAVWLLSIPDIVHWSSTYWQITR